MSKPLTADVADLALANITALSLLGTTTSADLGGTTQNDFAPANLASIVVVNLTASSAASITGLAAQPVGRMVVLYALAANVGNVTLTNEDVGSAAANRFDLPGAAIAVLTPGSACWLRYDTTTSRWKMLASTSSTTLPSLIVTGAVTFSGAITPASLPAGLANNYNPAGLANAATIRQAVNVGVVAILSGLTAQGAGRRITIQNLGTGILTITSEDTNSTAANRFSMPGGGTWELLTDGAITFLYDGTTARWIAENMTQAVPFVQINTVTSPAAITGSVNDYNPVGLAVAGVLRQALSGSATLTGLVAQVDGRMLVLENIDTSLNITLTNEDTGSAAANRFILPGAVSLLIGPGSVVILIYDGASARWRGIGQVGATTASASAAGIFGTGGDGDLVFDGIATVAGMVPVANVYTMTRDLRPHNMTINVGITVKTAGWRVFGSGNAAGPGLLQCSGGNGGNGGAANVGGVAGTSPVPGSVYMRTLQPGGAGGTTGAGGGVGTLNPGNLYEGFTGTGGNSSGGNATGVGAGGGGGSGTAIGGNGGSATPYTALGTSLFAPQCFSFFVPNSAAVQIWAGGNAGGGGCGGGAGSGGGGGGGGPGGCVALIFRTISSSLQIQANGGNGGNAGGGVNPGGGGGGGGGLVVIVTTTPTNLLPTPQVNAGTGGTGSGAGLHGGNGTNGLVYIFNS
ncbi:MAG TPA: hypothetical protein VGM94_01100 [Galbitalea sp.]|jgi:hypothetical protein